MLRRLDSITSQLQIHQDLHAIVRLLENGQFKKLLDIHNIIQKVQCFQCPPSPLCCDAKLLVQEVRAVFKRELCSRASRDLNFVLFFFKD